MNSGSRLRDVWSAPYLELGSLQGPSGAGPVGVVSSVNPLLLSCNMQCSAFPNLGNDKE